MALSRKRSLMLKDTNNRKRSAYALSIIHKKKQKHINNNKKNLKQIFILSFDALMKNTEMCIVIIVSVFLIGNLVFSSNNYKAVGTTDNRTNGNNNTTKTIASSPASAK